MKLPDEINGLLKYVGELDEQGAFNDCTAEATKTAIQILYARAGINFVVSKRLNYYCSGQTGKWGSGNDGRQPQWAVETCEKKEFGIGSELLCPSDDANLLVRPSEAAFADALTRFVAGWKSCGTGTDDAVTRIREMLANEIPVMLSGEVFSALGSLRPGMTYFGSGLTGDFSIGGHDIVAVCASMEMQSFLCLNWWGNSWNGTGMFRLPFSVFKSDFYSALAITSISDIQLPIIWEKDIMPRIEVYVPPGRNFTAGDQDIDVYGGASPSLVTLAGIGAGVMLDQNISVLTIPRPARDLAALQTGNELNLYYNGALLVSWALGFSAKLNTSDGKFNAALNGNGTMTLNGVVVSDVAAKAFV